MIDYLSNPGLHKLPCYTLLYRTELLNYFTVVCGMRLSTVVCVVQNIIIGYQQ